MKEKSSLPITRFFRYIWWHFVTEPFVLLRNKQNISQQSLDGNSVLYRTLFFWLLILLFILMPLMSLKFGRNSDETVSNNYGKDILKYLTTFGNDRSVFDEQKTGYSHMFYYGLSFDLLCAVANKVSPMGEFETRHMLNALFGLLAIFFAALIARRLMNWRAAVLVLLFMFISPQFLGYSMNNAKDIPFAAGYVAAIYFIIRFLSELPAVRIRTIIFLALSIGFTCTNKVNGIILLAYLGLFLLLMVVYKAIKSKNIKNEVSNIRLYLYQLVVIGIITYLITVAFWPYAHMGMIRNVWHSFRQFENIGNLMIHYELFDGERINMEFVPWYYTFKLMLITIPLYILAGFAASLLGIKWISKKANIYLIGILLFVTFFPVLYAMYKHSKLYNGWRHFLFIYPTFVVLAVCGWEFLLTFFSKRYLKYALIAVLAVSMAKPLVWMVKNYPNEVAYFNELTGGVNGAYSYYETDPLTNCSREAIEWFVKNVDVNSAAINVGSNIELESLRYYADRHPNKIRYMWLRDYNKSEYNWEYAILVTRAMSHSQLTTGGFPPKGTIHMVMVDDVPLCVIVKRPNTLKYEGFQFYLSDQFDKAVPFFQKAVAFDSLDEEAITTLGSCYINLGEFKKGVDYSAKGINLYNENYIAYNNLGVAEFFNKNYDKAITNYKKSLSYRVNWKSTILNLAKTYFFLKNYDSAIHYFKMANLYYPNDVEVYQNLGELYKAMDEKELALKVFEKILSISPNDNNASRNVEWLQNAINNNGLNDDIEKAKYYSSQNKHDSAIICLNSLLAKDSTNIDGLLNRGVAYYFMGQYNKALADFDHVLQLDPNKSDAWLKKAQVLSATGKKKKVLEYLDKALEINPQNSEVLNERGHYYFTINDWNNAFKDYSASLLLNPDQPRIFYSRAYTYSMQKRYNEAFPDVNEAIRLDPDYGDAYMFRAMLYFETGKYQESLAEIEKAKNTGFKVDPQFEANLQKQINLKQSK
jgi:tetratricopeptide (TPR) repeat protein